MVLVKAVLTIKNDFGFFGGYTGPDFDQLCWERCGLFYVEVVEGRNTYIKYSASVIRQAFYLYR